MGKTRTVISTLLIGLVGLGVSACSAGDDDSANDTFGERDAAMSTSPGSAEMAGETDDAGDAIAVGPPSVGAPEQTAGQGQALAIEAGITIGTSDIRAAADDVLQAIGRNNATVHTADVNIGTERDDGTIDGSGFFRVKVPPADLQALITDLDATVGPVIGRTQDTADVTDQLVDLDIRIGVERDVIDQFQSLLRDATEFEDIVAIQRVISERTISLEQLLAGQRNLEDRVAQSTLTIQLIYLSPEAAPSDAGGDAGEGIADAFATGWDAFVGALFAIGLVLAISAPFVLTALVLLGIVWLLGRRMNARRNTDRSITPEGIDGPTSDTDPAVRSSEELAAPSPEG